MVLRKCAGWFSCTSSVPNLYAGCKHCTPTSTCQRWCHSAAQYIPARTAMDRSMVRCLQQHLQKKDHISIYWVVAFQKGTEILHVLCLLWLFTMTDNSEVPDWTHWALIWLLPSHFRGKKVWQFKEMKKGVWKKHLKISPPGIEALCLEAACKRKWRAPSTDAEENEPFVCKAFFFFSFTSDKLSMAF